MTESRLYCTACETIVQLKSGYDGFLGECDCDSLYMNPGAGRRPRSWVPADDVFETRGAVHLKFDSEFLEPIRAGEKTATVRVAHPEELPEIGDRFVIQDETGDEKGTAFVTSRGYTTVDMLAKIELPGHEPYDSPEDALAALEEYYPDAGLGKWSRVEIVHWKDADMWGMGDE